MAWSSSIQPTQLDRKPQVVPGSTSPKVGIYACATTSGLYKWILGLRLACIALIESFPQLHPLSFWSERCSDVFSSECVSDREARRSGHRSGQIIHHLGSGPDSSLILGHQLWWFHLPWYLLPPGTGLVVASAPAHRKTPRQWLGGCRRGRTGVLVMHLEKRPQRVENRKVGTCPVTSSCRMIFVTSSFGVCLQPFLVVLAAGPPPTLRSLLPLRSVPGLAVFCQWPDTGNS